ncbi:hypothetical protein SAMN05216188_107323 [Lentzea xinjiangensis]|uniref:Uncharacterized protein n=1 Tax=Lentzea xinjiangensis TaxID=402600 RepID=A0A1H9LAC5_9PSEU|nr:hypothetical protein [Lentzea xinjiangensis]SER08095.1 hypothetical protein SAMN05216188_107323 [Lentzea xinjiangensis]
MFNLVFCHVRAAIESLRQDDRGYVGETVVTIAALVAAALAVAALLTSLFVGAASKISL